MLIQFMSGNMTQKMVGDTEAYKNYAKLRSSSKSLGYVQISLSEMTWVSAFWNSFVLFLPRLVTSFCIYWKNESQDS